MTTENRVTAREEELAIVTEEQRRLAEPRDYVWDKAQEKFWDLRNGTLHHEKAVDGSIPLALWRTALNPNTGAERLVPPSKDIMRIETDQTVEGATWWPGKPQIIRNLFIDKDGPAAAAGCRIYNQYKAPPAVSPGLPEPSRWIDHVKMLWPEDYEYFFDYCAHMVQRPAAEKCNAAIVMSGAQGIGKDAALRPIKAAMGAWNVKSVDPDELFSAYKPWLQTVMLVIDEVRPNKDEFHASSMYNILKPMIATPPDTLPLNDKYMALRYVVNVMRIFITTNDWMAMYVPAEDRRLYVMHSTKPQGWQPPEYFNSLFGWIEGGGEAEVAWWLMSRDIAHFAPKTQPRKTAGWEAVANTWSEPEDALDAALNALGHPEVLFGLELAGAIFDDRGELEALLKSPRKMGFRMHKAGYIAVGRADNERWRFEGKHRIQARLAFARQDLNRKEAVRLLWERGKALAAGQPFLKDQNGNVKTSPAL